MRDTDDYVALITPWHANKPKFEAEVRLIAETLVAARQAFDAIAEAFDLDTAIGVQLDAVGLWVGLSRWVKTPLPNVWFTWGESGLGWGEGVWKGPYDSTEGVTKLDDGTYRLFLRLKIGANHWDGSYEGMETILGNIFSQANTPGLYSFVQDNQDMSIYIVFSGNSLPQIYRSLITGGYFPIKPDGVLINYKMNSVDATPVFGWGVSNDQVGGWGTGSWAIDV